MVENPCAFHPDTFEDALNKIKAMILPVELEKQAGKMSQQDSRPAVFGLRFHARPRRVFARAAVG